MKLTVKEDDMEVALCGQQLRQKPLYHVHRMKELEPILIPVSAL